MNPASSLDQTAEARRQAATRLEEFRKLRARGALCTEVTEQFANHAATTFLDHHRRGGEYLTDAISLLAEIATLEEPCLAEPGQRATFPLLVEQLSDSFDPSDCLLYDRVFAQMISFCRRLPAGQPLDRALRAFGLTNEQDLLERKSRVRHRPPWCDREGHRSVRKVLALSRVTLGADVAVTSVALQKAKILFPHAERVLLGSHKSAELFGSDRSLRIRDVSYQTGGTLLERLEGWLAVVEAVEEEIRNLEPQQYVILDPDSRLLQLGMLPASPEESRYFFFESRGLGGTGTETISQLTLSWLNQMFGGEDKLLPSLWLREEDQHLGKTLAAEHRGNGPRHLVAVSFGVGSNPHKRIPDPFEEQLLLQLREEGCAVVLDKGFGDEEEARANYLTSQCGAASFQGGIGGWAGVIAASDEYIGYDSAGQHIAAALGVPSIDIFAAIASPIFRQRWRPTGKGIVKVVAAADFGNGDSTPAAILSEVIAHHRGIQFRRADSRTAS